MAVPTITALPAAPSRIGDPSNFFSESLALLDAQPDFVADCNAVAAYLNAANWNPNDWGDLSPVGSGSSPVSISNYPLAPPTSGTGFELIGQLDAMLAALVAFVSDGNAVAAYIDTFVDPLADPVSEPSRPIVSTVAPSQLRTDAIATFNSKASSFYASARAFALTLQALADYATSFLSGSEDWATVADAITSTDDWGTIA